MGNVVGGSWTSTVINSRARMIPIRSKDPPASLAHGKISIKMHGARRPCIMIRV